MVLYKPTIYFDLYFLIIVIAFIISYIFWRDDKKNRKLTFRTIILGILALFVTTLSIIATIIPLYHYYKHDYNVVEGYVENFSPRPPGGHRMESFTVNGIEFSYADDLFHMGYKRSFYNGGVIKGNGQHLRIGYIEEGDNIEKVIIVIEEISP